MIYAKCHPDRKHKAKGLCLSCYRNSKGYGTYAYKTNTPERKAKHLALIGDQKLRLKYGITSEERDEMAQAQNYKCFTCRRSELDLGRKLVIDHNHKTKTIRKLLCNDCNFIIGLCREDIGVLESIISYLKINA